MNLQSLQNLNSGTHTNLHELMHSYKWKSMERKVSLHHCSTNFLIRVKSSHFNSNPCDWEFYEKAK